MANFSGGSACAMAKDIAEGFLLVTERTYQRFEPAQLDQLAFELDRALRDIRGDQLGARRPATRPAAQPQALAADPALCHAAGRARPRTESRGWSGTKD